MIFLTVGTQLPFDRLVTAVDRCAGSGEVSDVFGQIAEPGPRGYYPKNFPSEPFLTPSEFGRCFSMARLVIAHAGMGSIISALSQNKPIVVLPRLASFGEHRNDHQLATARKFNDRANVWVAMDDTSLPSVIAQALAAPDKPGSPSPLAATGPDQSLIDAIRDVIRGPRGDPR